MRAAGLHGILLTEVPWPDFHEEKLRKAIEQYNNRDRRYGGVKEE